MQTRTDRRSTVIRYLAASLLFLIIGIRFYIMGDQIGAVIYAFTTGASLVMTFANLLHRD